MGEFDERVRKDALVSMIGNIHPKDGMFDGDYTHYFKVGVSAIRNIMESLTYSGLEASKIERFLDFACGYGRVLRHLPAFFPNATIYAYDVLDEGVDYCCSQFGAVGIHGSDDLSAINIDETFDFIWCGSLFTHVDRVTSLLFLGKLKKLLMPGGLLVFTTHGDRAVSLLKDGKDYNITTSIEKIIGDYKDSGYAYSDYPGSPGYGVSFCRPDAVLRIINEIGGLNLTRFTARSWDNHQDAYSVISEG